MRYTDVWNDLTRRIGFWLDLEHPYVTYHTKYIESVWWLLKQLYDQDLLYKGYTIQPYSPAAGTGLSSHELNQPGTYKPVKDTSVVAMFKVKRDANSEFLFKDASSAMCSSCAWTTTPWTLPSNCALTVGPKLEYVRVKTFNPYTHEPQTVVLAKARLAAYFNEKNKDAAFEATTRRTGRTSHGPSTGEFYGHQLEGMRYEQLLPLREPEGGGDAFKVIGGDFVTTEDGTGVVHTAPSFGADDMRVARQHNIGSLTLVDLQGRFKPEVTDFAGEVREGRILPAEEHRGRRSKGAYLSVDERIAIKLKTDGPRLQGGEVRAQLPALLAHRQARSSTTRWTVGSCAHREEGPLDRTEQDHHLEAREHRHRPLRQLAGEPAGLEPQPQSLLGHPAAHLAHRRWR
jgi:isoleucyl-tRNA synthetase